ncbi:MAG: MBL fold metallo-hydrolase [Chloroflexi bacterium]|nr:MBL fold metallo-hydrolase [Chloroflexota bacterium]
MSKKRHEPVTITRSFYQLGTSSFPAYLSLGDDGMLIEGGTGATFAIIVEQIEELGIEPERIKYVVLTHTHPDHIGAVPHLKRLWPHLKIAASPIAAKLLKSQRMLKEFLVTDRSITEIMINKGEIAELPPELENYIFEVNNVLEEGDRLDLGSGIVWTVYYTPGHSPCHISLFEEKEGTLAIGDATGFYVPEKDVFWPNYFDSLEAYCNSIRKLSALPAQRGALSHNAVVDGWLGQYFQRAIMAAESYHLEMLKRLGNGDDAEEIALEKAKWVNSLTDIQTFEVMYSLAKLMLARSQSEAGKEKLFTIP